MSDFYQDLYDFLEAYFGSGGTPVAVDPNKLEAVVPPESIIVSFYQGDVQDGVTGSWLSGGMKPQLASQSNPANFPTKLANNRGVLFAGQTAQSLSWTTDTDAAWSSRWWVAIARCPLASLTNSQVIAAINGNTGSPTARQPSIVFPVGSTMSSQIYDTALKTAAGPADPNFQNWNVLVGYRRGFSHQAVVNGTKTAQTTFGTFLSNQSGGTLSIMGMPKNSADFAIDCFIVGQGELSDSDIDRIVGWAMWRAGRQADLAADHPYKNAAPTGMSNPTRYSFDINAWNAWVTASNAIKTSHRGQPAPAVSGYTTVFFEDFLTPAVVSDKSLQGPSFYAPGHLDTVGASATTQDVTVTPSTYIHDGASALSLRMLFSSRWRTGSFTSINKAGSGRWWGKGIFEIRCKFPNLPDPRPGFFPAFWAYARPHLLWRTRNRLETDFFEYDGLDGTWINTTQHVHDPSLKTLATSNGPILSNDTRYKLFGQKVAPVNGFPVTVDIYDGQYHTWYVQIEDDYTYVVIDGVEVGRVPTSPELSADKYIFVDWAYVPNKGRGTIDPAQTYDMTIDYIKVMQKENSLQAVPTGFSALPSLAGNATVGSTLTVTPNTAGSYLEYYWYRDGVPIPTAITASYIPASDDVGHTIRCQVRNMSIDTQPCGWSLPTATVQA